MLKKPVSLLNRFPFTVLQLFLVFFVDNCLTEGSVDIISKQLSKMQFSIDKLLDGQKVLLSYHKLTNTNINKHSSPEIPFKSWEQLLSFDEELKEDKTYFLKMVKLFL